MPDSATSYLAHLSGSALYRSVVRAMAEGVVIHDDTGRILDANPSAEQILGLTLDQLTGRSPFDPRWRLVRADGQPAGPDDIPSDITQRTAKACRGRRLGVHRPSGDLAWLLVNSDPVTDDEGQLRLVVATFTDITESVVAKAELEASRAHLQHVVDVAPGVVYQYARDAAGRESLPFMSERVRTLLGLDARRPSGAGLPAGLDFGSPDERAATMWGRVHPEDVAKVREAFAISGRALSPLAMEFRFHAASGDWLWLRSHAIPDRVGDGVLWTGIILDVTHDHTMAELMRRAARREAMGELAAGLAHNFNNLLAAILPNIELALDPSFEPRPLLEDALHASRSAADLVRQLLAFTRSEVSETVMAPIELVGVVRDTLRFCRRTFDSRIRIEERLVEPPIHVLGQVSNLQQVVMNLCLNARDAMAKVPDPRLVVELGTRRRGDAATEVRLIVSDNGSGMSPETVRRLGEPFFTTKVAGQGTGLGLATVYGIVRDSRGTIECTSELGRGSRFEVVLPVCKAPEDQDCRDATATLEPRLQGLVMLVDDEPLVRAALARQVASLGLDSIEAASGDEALVVLARMERLPDLILLDLAMPGLPGDKVLVELVRRHPAIPVVVVSGNRGPSLTLDGAKAVLAKPVAREALVGTLERLLPPVTRAGG